MIDNLLIPQELQTLLQEDAEIKNILNQIGKLNEQYYARIEQIRINNKLEYNKQHVYYNTLVNVLSPEQEIPVVEKGG